MANIDNINSQMRKGMLEYCVLLILQGRPAYASELIACLKDASLIVVEGTLYPMLTRLKNDGLLSYTWQESTAGPPRKYYSVTDTGREVLNLLDSSWQQLASSITHLRNIASDSTPNDTEQ